MKVSSFAVARPVYYDRNSSTFGKSYEASAIAPHATTTRWSYTVPAGKAAYVEACGGMMWRDGIATVASLAQTVFNTVTSDTVTATVLQNRTYTNTGNDPVMFSLSQLAFLKAADVFGVNTFDGSTGGSFQYGMYAKFTQFDA